VVVGTDDAELEGAIELSEEGRDFACRFARASGDAFDGVQEDG
jgi:hypothetical protein